MPKRFLACLLSFSLLMGSIPSEVFSQNQPIRPASFSVPGRVFQPTFSSWQNFYSWIHTFPEFQERNLGSTLEKSASEARILLQALPLLKEGPVRAERRGNWIALIPALPSDPRQPVFIEIPAQGSYSEKVLALAQKLQKAKQEAWQFSETRYIDKVLKKFYEGSVGLSQEEILGEGAVPAGTFTRSNAGPEDLWSVLERRLGMVFRLNLQAGRAQDWKRETAEILRNYPQMSLEKALAGAFAEVHSLDFSVKGLIEDFLMHSKPGIEGGGRELKYLLKAGGKYYGIAQKNIYEYESGWKEFKIPGVNISQFEMNGKEYIFADEGLYAKDTGRFPEQVSWNPEFPDSDQSTGYVWQVVVREGTALLAAGEGLFAVDEKGIRPEFLEAGWFYRIVELDGRLFATTQKGLYVRKKGKWEPASERDGVYSLHHPGTLPSGWKKSLLDEIGGRIEKASQAASQPDSVPPLSSGPEGNIIGEDGRTIFSGFQKTANVFLGLLSAGALEGLSRLALSLGNLNLGFGAPAEEAGKRGSSAENVWPALERWAGKNTGLIQPGRAEEWKRETAEILRNNPSMPMEEALAEALKKIHRLDQEKNRQISLLFSGEPGSILKLARHNWIDRLGSFQGDLYFLTENRLYVQRNGRWVSFAPPEATVHYVEKLNGKIYIAANLGLYALEDGKWKKELNGEFYQFAFLDGRLYALSPNALYIQYQGSWQERADIPFKGLFYHISIKDGKIFVAGEDGLYVGEPEAAELETPEIKQGGWLAGIFNWLKKDKALMKGQPPLKVRKIQWKPVFQRVITETVRPQYRDPYEEKHPARVYQSAWIDGNLHIATEAGLFLEQGGDWKPLLEGSVTQIAELDGKLYAVASGKFLVEEKGQWKPALELLKDPVSRFAWDEDGFYFITNSGPKTFLRGWRRESILEDIAGKIREIQEQKTASSADSGLQITEDGIILGSDGLALFGGSGSETEPAPSAKVEDAAKTIAPAVAPAGEGPAVPLLSAPADFQAFEEAFDLRRISLEDVGSLRAFLSLLRDEWKYYQALWTQKADSAAPAVSDPVGFFSETLGMGQVFWTGTVLGPKISLKIILDTGRRVFKRHFEPKAPESVKAFEGFLDRVLQLEKGPYPNRTRKLIQDALIKASVLPAQDVAAYFDGLLLPDYMERVERFRSDRQPVILRSLSREVESLLKEKARSHYGPGRYNVAGVIVTGSYAYGTALPESDMDLFVLTWDGTSRDVSEFMAQLDGLRSAQGWPNWKDFGRHHNVLSVFGKEAQRLVSEFPSKVISRDSEVSKSYGEKPVSRPFYKVSLFQEILHRVTEPLFRVWVRAVISRQPVLGEPLSMDDKGNIVGKDGRTLFSGFQRTASVFLGLLSAGALEGLSRLALSLGNLHLGFGEEDNAPQASPEEEDGNSDSRKGGGQDKEPLEALLEEYKVPPSERNLRKKLTLQAVERIKTDIALFTGDPNVQVQFGDWWVTGQSLDGSYKVIEIPLEDIFIRAVDEKGVEEAVGAAIHETLHYLITRSDPNSPLTQKYALTESPKANNLLYQSVEDTRINSWGLLQQPGISPYMDSTYDAEWPENPEDTQALKRARLGILARSAIEIELPDKKKESWVAPHIQYANSILYYWRHRKAPPFLKDPLAKEVFEKTKGSLDRIRNIHPKEMGGILLEPMKQRAGTEALEALDREIYPYYEKLVQKSKEELNEKLKNGAKIKGPPQKGGSGKPQKSKGGSSDSQSQVDDLLDEMAEDLAERIHGHVGDKKEGKGHGRPKGQKPEGKDEAPGKKQAEPGKGDAGKDDDDSWIKRREQAVKEDQRLEKSWTTYERYKLRAKELGLIDKVDGIIKKILLPTTHVRLSRNHYHEGDEPDLDKYLDDVAQGRLDSPVMKVWNRRIRRSAKISLVLDISGSMGSMSESMDSPLDYGLLGIVAWAEVCQKNNLDFEVILFDDNQHVIHPFGKTVNTKAKDHIIEKVATMRGGSTAIGEAFRLALSNILKQHATHRFIIFATDEGHNTGDAPETWMPEARKNKVVTIAMVIGAGEAGFKHFDYAVRVERAEDFPKDLLDVLKKAIRSILGPLGWTR